MWYFIRVNKQEDIGKNEEERVLITDIKSLAVETAEDLGKFGCTIKGTYVHPATPSEETDSAPKWDDKDIIGKLYAAIRNVEENMESRTEQLSNEHKELKDAFEAERENNHNAINFHMNTIKELGWEINSMKEDISILKKLFVKYAKCKDTESPQGEKSYTAAEPITPGEFVYSSSGGIIGYAVPKKTADEWKAGIPDHPSGITEQVDIHVVKVNLSTMTAMEDSNPLPPQEPDIVEQIKAGENRLWELRKSVDCVAAIANSASETVSLKEHVIKLMSIHTGLNITGIRMCNKTYKIHYNCKEKGIYVELD